MATASSRKSASLRLMSDMRALQDDPPDGCSAGPIDEADLFIWTASVFGPEESPWEGNQWSHKI